MSRMELFFDGGRKALFFDIDGTLLSEVTGRIPESATEILSRVRSRGHLVFVNTGRSLAEVRKVQELVEVDGWLCGCGTYIEAEGRTLYHRIIPKERLKQICRAIREADMDGFMEGKEGCYVINPESRMEEGNRIRKSMAFSIRMMDQCDTWGDVEKFCVLADDKSDKAGFFRNLGLDIQVLDRGGNFYECVPEGHTKATAIDVILKEYGLGLKDACVFGDSVNDLSMFEHVPHAVLMGKHDPELEEYASMVTATVEQDGILLALERLGFKYCE